MSNRLDCIVIEKQALGIYYYKNSKFIIKMCCYCKYFFIDVANSINNSIGQTLCFVLASLHSKEEGHAWFS